MMYDTALEFLQSCYNILMPIVEKDVRGKEGMKYDDVNYMRTLRYVSSLSALLRIGTLNRYLQFFHGIPPRESRKARTKG